MSDAKQNTLVNALVGAVVTVVLSFVPFSPLLGGGVAGFLERKDGVSVGAISGAIAAIPLVGFVLLVVVAFGLFTIGVRPPVLFSLFGVLVSITLLAFALLYTIGLSALGGYLGVYVAEELRDDAASELRGGP